MDSPQQQLESLSQKIEERERLSRRRAWLITLIPIIFAGLFLTYTIWQIAQAELKLAQKTSELASVDNEIIFLRTQLPEAQTTLGAVQQLTDELQSDLSLAQAGLATASAELTEKQKELIGAGDLIRSACSINAEALKEYSSNYTPQAQVLLYLLETQFYKDIPWNPGGFSETDGFNSPDFSIFVLQNAVSGYPLISLDYPPGTLPWNILKVTTAPQNGDIAYYQSGYSMFYFELPVSYGSSETTPCVIGMTPLGVIAQKLGFAQELGFLKVPYP